MGLSWRWRKGHSGRPCWLDVEASTSETSVAVMAPALTEGGPQKPENLLSTLPASGFLSAEQATQLCQNREVLTKFVVSANVQPSTIDDQCLHGIPKDLIRDVINSKFPSGLDGLSDLIVTGKEREAISAAIMSDPSMGDPSESMGFFKNILGPEEDDETSALGEIAKKVIETQVQNIGTVCQEKQSEEDRSLEQIMAFDTDITPMQGDIGQNVEEILQVIKSMEGAETSEIISNVGVSEPSQSTTPEGVSEIFPDAEHFSSFERDLLSGVDVMGLCSVNMVDAVDTVDTVPTEAPRTNDLTQQKALVERRQFENERRCAFLIRRLRKLESRLIGRHVSEEVTGVIEQSQNNAKKHFYQEFASVGSKSGTQSFPDVSGNLSSFLQKVEKSVLTQNSSAAVRQRSSCRYFGAGSKDNYPVVNTSRHQTGIPVKVNGSEVESVAGPLETHLKFIQKGLDSDCTESSSGGDSCDEMQKFVNTYQHQLSISKRSGWRFALERSNLASRWTWLQAQISDLEYKIRQHNDLQRQIRATKGPVVLMDNAEAVNGYSGVLPGSTGCHTADGELPASRTRPFLWSVYRKRKLLHTERLHEVSKRASRPSTLKCDCDGSLPYCALCTGRSNPMEPMEPMDQLAPQNRIALVDPGFHPVLSIIENDVTHTTHCDAIMKTVEWQQKVLRGNLRMAKVKEKEVPERRNKKVPEHRPSTVKYASRLKKSSSTMLTARIKKKVLQGKRNRESQNRNRLSRKRVATKAPVLEDDEEASAFSSSSKHSSPVPSPVQQASTTEKNSVKEKSSSNHGRVRHNSYDIDNIVIPYSVAAATRLEKLQYKEILTPKWRVCDEPPSKVDVKNGAIPKPSQDSDVEDVSDETVALRHERSEIEENKRFMPLVNTSYHSRNRRRLENRNDSGANTPDPMSPHMSDFGGDAMSPLATPPATPSNIPDGDNSQQQQIDLLNRSGSFQNSVRRKTTPSSIRSIKDRDKDKEETPGVVNEEEHPLVPPYDKRLFPLSEETYDKMLLDMPVGHWQVAAASVFSQEDEKDDDLRKWPEPYAADKTPYHEKDFNGAVHRICATQSILPRLSKVIILGDLAVGKSSLVNRLCHKTFDNNYKATIGVDFEVERYDLLGVPFNLQIWDTAGQERFRCIAASYYRGANVIMVVFDMGSLMSLNHCQDWLAEAHQANSGPHHIFLVGTKKDLLSCQVYEVVEKKAAEISRLMRAELWAVSAKTGHGVPELFMRVAALAFNDSILREFQCTTEPIKYGTDFISLKRDAKKVRVKVRKFPKC